MGRPDHLAVALVLVVFAPAAAAPIAEHSLEHVLEAHRAHDRAGPGIPGHQQGQHHLIYGPQHHQNHTRGGEESKHGTHGLGFLKHVHLYMATTLQGPFHYITNRALPQSSLLGHHWPHLTYIAGEDGWNEARGLTSGPVTCTETSLNVALNSTTVHCSGMQNPIVVVPCTDTKWGATGPCCKTDFAFRHFASLPLQDRLDMKFFIFSDDDTYHDPTGFSAFLSLFNPDVAFFAAPTVQANAGSDFGLHCVMNLATPICQSQGQCIGLQPNCHSFRNGGLEGKKHEGQKLDLSKPYGGVRVTSSTKPECGDDACERCLAKVYAGTHEPRDDEPSHPGCFHGHLQYAGYIQPLIASAAAVKRLLPTFLGTKGLRAQCQVLGVTHDNALGLLLWKLQIPTVSHLNSCSRLWYPPGRGQKNDLMYANCRTPKDFEETYAFYAARYNASTTSKDTSSPHAWRALRHKIHLCFALNTERRLPAFNEAGEQVDGGVQLTRYWKRTSAADRTGGEPFVFEDCANYPDDANSNVSKTWFARPPRPLLPHHSHDYPTHEHQAPLAVPKPARRRRRA